MFLLTTCSPYVEPYGPGAPGSSAIDALMILNSLPQGRVCPGVIEIEVLGFFFFRVYDQIVDRWIRHFLDCIALFIDFLDEHLPIAPFHAKELVADVNNDRLSSGFFSLTPSGNRTDQRHPICDLAGYRRRRNSPMWETHRSDARCRLRPARRGYSRDSGSEMEHARNLRRERTWFLARAR